MKLTFATLLYLFSCTFCAHSKEGIEYWRRVSEEELVKALGKKQNNRVAKNVIIFVGDGMGPHTITASRIYRDGESSKLVFEDFPNLGLLKTYSVDKQVPDSASTATALFCGVKNNFETAGVDHTVKLTDCKASLNPKARVSSIIAWAQKSGKGTGFVTNTRVTHATPSALYAHTAERRWECEAKMPPNAHDCKDIARQLIEDYPGKDINVIMGGGRQCLKSNSTPTLNDPIDTWSCYRQDGRDLIQEWISDKQRRGVSYNYTMTTSDLENVNLEETEFLLGIFANSHLSYEYARDRSPQGTPSLEQMTTAAVKVLSKRQNGFVLVVEGGLIDVAHHRTSARKALEETLGLNDAVNATLALLREKNILEETLLIVTSDHTHALSINGYPKRGNDILGIAQNSKADGVPYTTLSYATSGRKGYHFNVMNGNVAREDPSQVNTSSYDYAHQSAVLTDENAHGGGDVAIYAIGPMAHLFHSVHEQNYVAAVVSYAARIGSAYHVPHLTSGCDIPYSIICFPILLLSVCIFKLFNVI